VRNPAIAAESVLNARSAVKAKGNARAVLIRHQRKVILSPAVVAIVEAASISNSRT